MMRQLAMKSLFSMRMLVILFASLTLIYRCASPSPNVTSSLQNVMAEDTQAHQEIQEINERLLATAQAHPKIEDYTVREGDLLQIVVIGENELSTTARVSTEGSMTLPLLGSLKVKGYSVHELERIIEDAYGRKYLQDPHVTILIKEQQGGKITLLGAISKPGTYDYYVRQPLLNVLAMGGGLAPKAGTLVHVRRMNNDSSKTSVFIVDLEDLIKNGQEQLNVEIEQGDVVFIPEAGAIYVEGAVEKPGSFSISQNMSIHEAIVRAGGFAWYAGDKIKLIRHAEKTKKEVVELSSKDIDAMDLVVRDRDVIFVEVNPVKQAIYGFRFSFFGTGIALQPPR
jgi:polysaccharide biosynthesis/export protein